MKQFLIMIALLLGVIAQPVSAQDVKQKVAVYMTGDEVQDSYKKVIGAKLVSAITDTDKYAAVERTADFLAALASEQDYQTSGEVRDSQIAKLGQRFGVKFVVVADVSEVFEELFISARMINVETGLVEKACDINGQAANMPQLIEISNKIAKELLRDKKEEARLEQEKERQRLAKEQERERQRLEAEYQAKMAQEAKYSKEPINYALCVRRNGQIRYITQTDWYNMTTTEKSQCTKLGVYLSGFVVTMQDSPSKQWSSLRAAYYPNSVEADIIVSNQSSLNQALIAFGGQVLTGMYWTNYTYGDNKVDVVDMSRSSYDAFVKRSKNQHYKAREILHFR